MKKTRRIYKELGLQLRNKSPKRRVKAKLREDRQEAVGPNDVWAIDALHRCGNHPIFQWVGNWTSHGLFQFHCGCDPANGYVGPFVVVNP